MWRACSVGPGVAPPVTTIDFPGTGLHVHSLATIPTGGTVDVDATVDLASAGGSFTAAVTVNDVIVLGQTVDLAGSVTGDAAGIDTFEVVGSVPGPVALLPGADLTSLNVRWNNTALTASGRLTIGGGAITLDVTARIVDAQNWELTAAAAVGSAPLSPLPGLTVAPAALTGTVRNVAGTITFDVQAAINGSWDPVPVFHLRQLAAQLSNFAPPSDCPAIPAGAVWFRLGGAATVDVPGQPINVNAAACAGLGSDAWSVGATATLGSWQPVPGIPVSVESLGLHITGIGLTGIVIEATGGLNVSGVHLGALVQIDPINLTIVVDGFGDLSTAGLGLAPGSVGHIVLASAEVPTFRFRDDWTRRGDDHDHLDQGRHDHDHDARRGRRRPRSDDELRRAPDHGRRDRLAPGARRTVAPRRWQPPGRRPPPGAPILISKLRRRCSLCGPSARNFDRRSVPQRRASLLLEAQALQGPGVLVGLDALVRGHLRGEGPQIRIGGALLRVVSHVDAAAMVLAHELEEQSVDIAPGRRAESLDLLLCCHAGHRRSPRRHTHPGHRRPVEAVRA